MIDYSLIGARLRNARRKAGLTQEALAERVEITTVYLSKIENGKVHPTLDTLAALCEFTETDIGALLSNISPEGNGYGTEQVIHLFQACSPAVKQIALEILDNLAKL